MTFSSYFLVDRVLPGLIVSATWMPLWTLALWLLHRNLKRHITRTTADQTAALTGAGPANGGSRSAPQVDQPPR